MSRTADIVVVGGGISGLTVAWYLRRLGMRSTVLEGGRAPGGTMQTVRDGPWLVESGPNSALETTPLFGEMFEALGLAGERLYAEPAADRRYILRDGALHPLPMSAWAFLRSPLWSFGGKLRLLGEPLSGRAQREETVAEFVRRRLGEEFLEYAVNPFVAGVYAGDPAALSVRAALPKLYALEARYGGLVLGMIRGARERKARAEKAKDRAKMISFRSGMQAFPSALGRALGSDLRLNCAVTSLRHSRRGEFRIGCRLRGAALTYRARAVVIAVPAYAAADLIRPTSPSLAGALEQITYPPVTEVFLGYPSGAVRRPLDGFGYLVPAREGRKILGTIWSSSLFPGRAPSGHVALTTFVGGSRQPEMALLGDRDLLRTVTSEIRSIIGIDGDPVYTRIVRWKRAIPQYRVGHLEVMEQIEELERHVPGLYFCGNYRGGIAVGDCIASGDRLARRIAGEWQPHVTSTRGEVRA